MIIKSIDDAGRQAGGVECHRGEGR